MAKHTKFWFAAIKEAKRRSKAGLKPFLRDVALMSQNWVTCACGKQDPLIPRLGSGSMAPVDDELFNLGSEFADDVSAEQDPDAALATLLKIEQRSAEILAELDKR